MIKAGEPQASEGSRLKFPPQRRLLGELDSRQFPAGKQLVEAEPPL